MNAINNQKGSFIIELSFVLMFLCLLTLFTADIAMQLFTRTKLDRVSYSLVNVLKERTRFYKGKDEEKFTITNNDYEQLHQITKKLLSTNNFKLIITGFDGKHQKILPQKMTYKSTCNNPNLTGLIPVSTITGTKFPTYQVSLCLPYHSWFGKLTHGKTVFFIQSTSVMPGR